MTEAINYLFNWIRDVVLLIEKIRFNIYGIDISFLWLIIAFIITCIVVSVFWKGAKM